MHPGVTIALLPREKYSFLRTSLLSLEASTPVDHRVLIVLGRAPRRVRTWAERYAASRPNVTVVAVDDHIGPFESINTAVAACTTEQLVIADNDVHFRAGWLEALLGCMADVNADAVVPLVLIGAPDTDVIHYAGGESHVEVSATGRRSYVHRQFHEGASVRAVGAGLHRGRTELLETHCILGSLATWKAVTPLDPFVAHSTNTDELSTALASAGARTWFEPASTVVYMHSADAHPTLRDLPVWHAVWGERWIARDVERMASVHDLDELPAATCSGRWWFGDHRRVALYPLRDRIGRAGERLRMPAAGHFVWRLIEHGETAANSLYSALTTRRTFHRLRTRERCARPDSRQDDGR